MRQFSSRRALSEAVVVATALTLLIASKPTRDREVHVKAGLDLALAYRDQPGDASHGVVSRWLVPIYDFSQGLGQRVPNLVSQVSIHPLILVRRGLTVEQMFHLRLFMALTVALLAICLTLSSWSQYPSVWTRALSYAAIVPGVLTYTVHNDWYYQAEQLCGLVSLSVVMFSRVWQSDEGDERVRGVASLTVLTGTAGWILYLGGHPDWWPFAVWWLPFYIHFIWRYVVRRVSAALLSCCATAVALTGGVAVVEIVTQDWSGAARYSTQAVSDLSVATLWSADNLMSGVSAWLKVWLRMLLAPLPFANFASGQHVRLLSELGDGAPRSLNMPVLLLAAGTLVSAACGDRHLQSAARNYMRFAGSVVLGLLFHDLLGFVPVLKAGITNQTADAIGPGLVALTVVAVVHIGGRLQRLVRTLLVLTAVGVIGIAVLYFGDPRKVSGIAWLVSSAEDASQGVLSLDSHSRNLILDDGYAAAPSGGWPRFEAATSIPHAAAVIRSGHPLVFQVSWARAQGALVPREQQRQFNGFVQPDRRHCDPLALDFLAISRVVQFSSESVPPCSAALLDLDATTRTDSDPSQLHIDSRRRGTTWIHLYEPSEFRSFWLMPEMVSQIPRDCGVLVASNQCLGREIATAVISSTHAPLRYDEAEHALTYEWRRISSSQQVLLLPLSYDSALQVVPLGIGRSAQNLRRWNVGGLVAVEVPFTDLRGTLGITIRADNLMRIRSAIPWLGAGITVALLAWVIRRRESLTVE